MLPFLKRDQEVGTIAEGSPIRRKRDEDHEFDSLETAMRELHEALKAGNYSGASQIFRSAFELLDSEPHEEGPHI